MKKVLFIVASKGFRDEEYFEPKQVLEDAGVLCEVTSENPIEAIGTQGAYIMPTISLENCTVSEFDAIILVGGKMINDIYNDFRVQDIVKEAERLQKILCAICSAPKILARLQLLEERTVCAHESIYEELKNKGIQIIESDTYKDDTKMPIIISGKNYQAAHTFGHTIKEALLENT